MSLKYRADIDGLRALAVLPVVFYHYRVPPFTGGFVGVDVFFVVSGFLITSLILDEMRRDEFTFLRFYERRIRRIFPALFALLFACSIAALILIFPTDLDRFANSLLATDVFGSNFEFWSRSGYFDTFADRKPLLHTWSLAVEEQFYLLFPLILFALRKQVRLQAIAAGSLLVLSLAASLWAVEAAPISAFYLMPFRFWELMLGAMFAFGVPAPGTRWLAEGAGVLGLALVAYAVFALDADSLFPGVNALFPCVGAALVIYAGMGMPTFVARVLSLAPIVWVGLISYSLYLWHWPLLVFTKYTMFRPLNAWETAALIGLSFVLAALSWRYIERPFRGRASHINKTTLFRAAGAATVAVAIIGVAAKIDGGLPQRFDAHVRAILDYSRETRAQIAPGGRCIGANLLTFEEGRVCKLGDPRAAAPSFIIWGDSHVGRFAGLIGGTMARVGRSGYLALYHTCPPMLGVATTRSTGCREFDQLTLEFALAGTVTDVYLGAIWGYDAEGIPYLKEGGTALLTDDETKTGSLETNPAVFARGLERLIAKLRAAGKRVVIIGPVPEIGWMVPETLARIEMTGADVDIRPTLMQYLERQKHTFPIFDALKAKYGVSVVYPHANLCAGGHCQVAKAGMPLYNDGTHLNHTGVEIVAPLLAPYLPTRTMGAIR